MIRIGSRGSTEALGMVITTASSSQYPSQAAPMDEKILEALRKDELKAYAAVHEVFRNQEANDQKLHELAAEKESTEAKTTFLLARFVAVDAEAQRHQHRTDNLWEIMQMRQKRLETDEFEAMKVNERLEKEGKPPIIYHRPLRTVPEEQISRDWHASIPLLHEANNSRLQVKKDLQAAEKRIADLKKEILQVSQLSDDAVTTFIAAAQKREAYEKYTKLFRARATLEAALEAVPISVCETYLELPQAPSVRLTIAAESSAASPSSPKADM